MSSSAAARRLRPAPARPTASSQLTARRGEPQVVAFMQLLLMQGAEEAQARPAELLRIESGGVGEVLRVRPERASCRGPSGLRGTRGARASLTQRGTPRLRSKMRMSRTVQGRETVRKISRTVYLVLWGGWSWTPRARRQTTGGDRAAQARA